MQVVLEDLVVEQEVVDLVRMLVAGQEVVDLEHILVAGDMAVEDMVVVVG
jgi:hypothetical protein